MAKAKKEVKTKEPKAVESKQDERFSTGDNGLVQRLTEKGFHVVEQYPVDDKMLWVFKESKSKIEEEG